MVFRASDLFSLTILMSSVPLEAASFLAFFSFDPPLSSFESSSASFLLSLFGSFVFPLFPLPFSMFAFPILLLEASDEEEEEEEFSSLITAFLAPEVKPPPAAAAEVEEEGLEFVIFPETRPRDISRLL